jgi:hypothetical protein
MTFPTRAGDELVSNICISQLESSCLRSIYRFVEEVALRGAWHEFVPSSPDRPSDQGRPRSDLPLGRSLAKLLEGDV